MLGGSIYCTRTIAMSDSIFQHQPLGKLPKRVQKVTSPAVSIHSRLPTQHSMTHGHQNSE